MKIKLILTLTVLFCACHSVKKTSISEKQKSGTHEVVKVDSTTFKASGFTSVKNDSAKSSTSIDSNYERKTTIEEEIEVVNDSTKKIKRKTTTEERGNKKTEAKTEVKSKDSTAHDEINFDHKKAEGEKDSKNSSSVSTKDVTRKGAPILTYVGIIALVFVSIYLTYKIFIK